MKLHASGTTATSADVHLVYGNEGGGGVAIIGGGVAIIGGGVAIIGGGVAIIGGGVAIIGGGVAIIGGGGEADAGVTWLLDDEKSESKTVLFNLTVNVYAVPFDNPVTTIGDPDPVCEIELGDETTV